MIAVTVNDRPIVPRAAPAPSQDVRVPPWGPAFLRLSAWPYRAEMALLTVFLFAVLFYWRLQLVGNLDVLSTVFWFLWPDLAAFIPIGVASRGARSWPKWGPLLYNLVHSFLPWAVVFAIVWIVTAAIPWPLLGWPAHISLDRSVGYYLRHSDSA